MEDQKSNTDASWPVVPENKRTGKWVRIFLAVIFWIFSIFLAVHVFFLGLQYIYFIFPLWCFVFFFIKEYKIEVLPRQEKVIFLYKTSFIYKFFYVNRTYENGSKKQIAFKQYRIMFYFHLLFAFIAFSPVIKEPLNFEEKNFSINGYIKEVKKISTLSGCGQVILTIMNEKGHKIEIYSNNKYDNIIKLDKNSLYVFEIDYSKNSPIWICRRHDHLYSMKKDGNYIISHTAVS